MSERDLIMTLTIKRSFFEDSEQDVEDGGEISVQVDGGLVFITTPESMELRLSLDELHALHEFAILEAKQQGYEL